METNTFLKYMEQRYQQKNTSQLKLVVKHGPVVTISRETGCRAKPIANLLATTINQRLNLRNGNRWKLFNKEIINETAQKLHINPLKIKYIFKQEPHGTWDEIINSISTKYYKSDRKIRNTVYDVVRSIALSGNAIIVGRGGVAIAHDVTNSLHVYLQAPLEWRTSLIFEKRCFQTIKEAEKYVIENDIKRKNLRNSFYGANTDYTSFDLTLNPMKFTEIEIVEIIIKTMELKSLLS